MCPSRWPATEPQKRAADAAPRESQKENPITGRGRVYAASFQCPVELPHGDVPRIWRLAGGGYGRPDAPIRARVQGPYARSLGVKREVSSVLNVEGLTRS